MLLTPPSYFSGPATFRFKTEGMAGRRKTVQDTVFQTTVKSPVSPGQDLPEWKFAHPSNKAEEAFVQNSVDLQRPDGFSFRAYDPLSPFAAAGWTDVDWAFWNDAACLCEGGRIHDGLGHLGDAHPIPSLVRSGNGPGVNAVGGARHSTERFHGPSSRRKGTFGGPEWMPERQGLRSGEGLRGLRRGAVLRAGLPPG